MDNIHQKLIDADCILIGIGEEFQESLDNNVLADRFSEDYKKIYPFDKEKRMPMDTFLFYNLLQKKDDGEKMEAYQILAQLLKDKNYFIVSTCNDDLIFHSNLNSENIVTPCGTYQFLQCPDNCNNELIESRDVIASYFLSGKHATCQHCQKELVFNHASNSNYNEKGYLSQWEKYTGWLQKTLNKKLVVLELGVGMKYPTVIRWPFEKVIFFNQKSFLIRVHSHLSQVSEEIIERALPVSENSIDFIRNLKYI